MPQIDFIFKELISSFLKTTVTLHCMTYFVKTAFQSLISHMKLSWNYFFAMYMKDTQQSRHQNGKIYIFPPFLSSAAAPFSCWFIVWKNEQVLTTPLNEGGMRPQYIGTNELQSKACQKEKKG